MAAEFENDVKTYGTQAMPQLTTVLLLFENDVKTYGTQAQTSQVIHLNMFENDVKTYGTQAEEQIKLYYDSLRMM